MVVGEGRSSEKGHLTHPEVLMELVSQGPEGLGRKFQSEHRGMTLHLVLRKPQVSEGYKDLKVTW